MTHNRPNTDAAKILDVICLDLVDDISFDWKKLGGHLFISKCDIDSIDANNPRIWEKTMEMLNTWRQRRGKGATVQVLKKALEKIGRTELLQRVEGMSIPVHNTQMQEVKLKSKNEELNFYSAFSI